jgi:predicted RNA binding protein YcfA (HicA-like mRNA interferase family)
MSHIVPIPFQKLVRVLEMEGFALVRERGDHIFSKPGILRPLVVPRYDACPFSSSKTCYARPRSAESDISNF